MVKDVHVSVFKLVRQLDDHIVHFDCLLKCVFHCHLRLVIYSFDRLPKLLPLLLRLLLVIFDLFLKLFYVFLLTKNLPLQLLNVRPELLDESLGVRQVQRVPLNCLVMLLLLRFGIMQLPIGLLVLFLKRNELLARQFVTLRFLVVLVLPTLIGLF